ncbi:hypothetical protein F441_18660 [Phytophthora nicotianae CJ01A1]|uniref:Uncharacterized protein n=2 Tax=Phytophthora nicotianae TaxID=4792 RepID=W2PJL4_PHYN3|nr:hypothetical protein PPTG_17623 [Phytophthora nicotianae INRA-310]ETN01213.1 hypothetical protein PPTG_17623 [Phytophthora nicotianae INRA-310]ETP04589.1 hypothetical protein F441_18660 [Phytophthora nicotianae CJ01A1]
MRSLEEAREKASSPWVASWRTSRQTPSTHYCSSASHCCTPSTCGCSSCPFSHLSSTACSLPCCVVSCPRTRMSANMPRVSGFSFEILPCHHYPMAHTGFPIESKIFKLFYIGHLRCTALIVVSFSTPKSSHCKET